MEQKLPNVPTHHFTPPKINIEPENGHLMLLFRKASSRYQVFFQKNIPEAPFFAAKMPRCCHAPDVRQQMATWHHSIGNDQRYNWPSAHDPQQQRPVMAGWKSHKWHGISVGWWVMPYSPDIRKIEELPKFTKCCCSGLMQWGYVGKFFGKGAFSQHEENQNSIQHHRWDGGKNTHTQIWT